MGLTVCVTGMTGVATTVLNANSDMGATTLHSWIGAGLSVGKVHASQTLKNMNEMTRLRWKSTDVIVIDEVSMLSPNLITMLDHLAGNIRGPNKGPFGGIQVITCGDWYQLPPVIEKISEYSDPSLYTTETFSFETNCWKKTFKHQDHIVLEENFRQKDKAFQKVLNTIRIGQVDEDVQNMLNSRLGAKLNPPDGVQPTILCARVEAAKQLNDKQLDELPGRLEHYSPVFHCGGLTGKAYDAVVNGFKSSHGIEDLFLKEGAAVMLTMNLDVAGGLINGLQGLVKGFSKDNPPLPIVRFANGREMVIRRFTWEKDESKKGKQGQIVSVSQIPLKLAWAMTIHKAQSTTLDWVIVDLQGMFAPGQAYVALSRCRTVEGLSITGYNQRSICASKLVKKFYEDISGPPSTTSSSDETPVIKRTVTNHKRKYDTPYIKNYKKNRFETDGDCPF